MILTACPIPNRHTIPKHWQFHWPTLVELNDKFDPYLWQNEEERGSFMKDDAPFSPHISYTGLPPFPPQPRPSDASPPTIADLSPQIILSADKLFFIAHNIGNVSTREWCLVWVVFRILSPCTRLPCKMVGSWLNFMTRTPMTCIAMPQINGFGWCSIAITLHPHLALWMPTSSHLLIRSRTELCATIQSQYDDGSILPTVIPSFTVLLILQLFAGKKHAIVLIRLIGMSLAANFPCSSIRFLNLLFRHIPSTWTMAFTLSSLI